MFRCALSAGFALLSWLQANVGNVQCARIEEVGHLLHLQDEGQTPVLSAMRAFLERVG
jgi:hypothetical protein